MPFMPRGQPQSVPDPEGDLYDSEMAKLRQQRAADDEPSISNDGSSEAGFRIAHPNTLESFIPVVGPVWEAAADVQDGDYWGAAGNVVLAGADLLPVGEAVKGIRAASKGIGLLKSGSVTAGAARKVLRRVGMAGPGQEIHHSIPLNGIGRNVQDWRNHYPFLKVLDQAVHRRLTGSWMGMPRYDPIRRFWYGTPDWMKIPGNVAAHTADAILSPAPNSTDDD